MKLINVCICSLGFAGLMFAGTSYDTSLASPDSNGDPGCYIGTGCVNAGWTVSDQSGTELGLTGIVRFVGPAAENNNVYTVPVGTAGGDALWDFSFSIDTQPNGVGSALLSDYTYSLNITDSDNDFNTTVAFNPTAILDDDTWGPASPPRGMGVVAGDWGAQNSENLSFFGPIGFDPNAVDNYTLTLTELNNSTQMVDNSVSIQIDAVAPEPGTIALFGSGLAALALAVKRRARKSQA